MSTTAIGFRCKGFVMVSVSGTTAHYYIKLHDQEDNVIQLDENKLLAASGEVADVVNYTEYIKRNLALDKMKHNGRSMTTPAAANFMRSTLASGNSASGNSAHLPDHLLSSCARFIIIIISGILLLLFVLFLASSRQQSSSIINFASALSTSPNGNNILDFTATHLPGLDLQLSSCHIQSDALIFFCGMMPDGGTEFKITRYIVSPFSLATASLAIGSGTNFHSGCVLIETISRFVCNHRGTSIIRFYRMADLVEMFALNAVYSNTATRDCPLLYFDNFLYSFSNIDNCRAYRFNDLSTTPAVDTNFEFSLAGFSPRSACLSSASSVTNRQIIVQFEAAFLAAVDISGAGASNFAQKEMISTSESVPWTSDSLACTDTLAYTVHNTNKIYRFQLLPSLVELDFLDLNKDGSLQTVLGSIRIFGDGQYLLLMEGFTKERKVLLLDVTTNNFPNHTIIELIYDDNILGRTFAGPLIAAPSGTDPRDGGTFKVFAFAYGKPATIYELVLKNLDGPITIPPHAYETSATVLSGSETLVFCRADSSRENMYCGDASANRVPVRFTLEPLAKAATGAANAGANGLVFCDLGEVLSGYYCIYDRGGSSDFRSFNTPSLSTRTTANTGIGGLDSPFFNDAALAFAAIGGSHYLFVTDELGDLYRVSVDGSSVIGPAALDGPSSNHLQALATVLHCPTQTEDKWIIVASEGAGAMNIAVGRINGDLSNAAFPAGAYNSHFELGSGFPSLNRVQTMACSKTHIYVGGTFTSKRLAKLAIDPFAITLITDDDPRGGSSFRGLTLSPDAKFVIVTGLGFQVMIYDTATLNLVKQIEMSQSDTVGRCVAGVVKEDDEVNYYCPLSAHVVTVRMIPYSAAEKTNTKTFSSTKTKTLQSITKTRTTSTSPTLVSLTSTKSLQSLTTTVTKSASSTLRSLTATRSVSSTQGKTATSFSLSKTQTRTSSATLFSRSKSLTPISSTRTGTRSWTKSSTITLSESQTKSASLQSLTTTQTLFSRSSTLSSSTTRTTTVTATRPPTATITRSMTKTTTKSASLQSLTKTKSRTNTRTRTQILPLVTTTTTSAAPSNNAINNLPSSSNIVNALVVSVPSCPSTINSKCQVRHPQSNECRCLQNTFEQNITLLPSFAFLPSTSPTSQLIDQVGNPCVRNEFTLGICTASTSERFISSYSRSGGTTSENGVCEQANPFTNDCSCRAPSTKASFALASGSSTTFTKKFVTFCLPPNGDLSVFWTIHPDVATASNRAEASCVSPNGNVTCECAAGASKTTFGASIFPPDSSSTDPVPGDLTFCKAKPAEPEEEVNLPVTTTGTVVGIVGGFIEGGGANAVVGIQVAALLMTLCDNNPNVSTSGAKSVVVFFEYPGLPPSAGGLAFMLTLTLGAFFLHALVCFLVGLKRFATSQKIEFDPDKIDYFEEEIETPSFLEQIRFASLQLRFPHWSFFVMNIGFSGVVVESTILLQNTEDDIMVLVGAIGLVLSLIYIALTLYFSYWGIRGVADVTIFDVDESGTSKKLVSKLTKAEKQKKKLKRTVAELTTEVSVFTDDDDNDDDAFPPAPSRSGRRGVSRSSSSSSTRHRRASSSRKQSSSRSGRSRTFSPRRSFAGTSSSDDDDEKEEDDEEKGHKWLTRRKSVTKTASPTSRDVVKSSSGGRNSNSRATSTKSSSRRRRSSSQHSRRVSSVVDDNNVIVYSESEHNETTAEETPHAHQDRKSSTVKMPTDEDDAAVSEGEDNQTNVKSSSSSSFSKRNERMKKNIKRNPLRPPPRRIKDDEDTSSAEDLDLDESDVSEEMKEEEEEEEEENQHEQQKDNDNELTDDDKPPHYVKYGKAMKLFHRFCSFSEYILPSGWWIKHCLYNRRYASMYNSFQPRPTAWAPTTIRLFLFSVSVASSLGGCLIPVTYVGTVALLIALMFLVARPCRRPFDNILLALQLILGSTLAFSRSSDPELSVKLFYGVIGVTFVYVFHIMLLEGLETVSLNSFEMLKFKGDGTAEHRSDTDDDDDDDDTDVSSNDSRDAQKKIALPATQALHEKRKKR